MGARAGSGPDGQREGRSLGSRQRDDRRPQRNGDGREQSLEHARRAADEHRLRRGTTTARRRSARAPTSRVSTSAGCKPTTAPTTSRTTPCSSSPATSIPTRRSAGSRKSFGAIPKPTRALPRLYTDEPVQDGERSVAIRRVGDTQLLGILYHTVPGAHPDAIAVDALAKVMTIEPARPPLQGTGRGEEGVRSPELCPRAARSRASSSSSPSCR